MLGLRTLILNADYQPKNILKLSTISAEAALSDFFSNNCTIVDTYDRPIKTMKVENRIAIPSVIAYKQYFPRMEKVSLIKAHVLLRDSYSCVYCGKPLSEESMTFDHYKPVSRGGSTSWDNILSSCKKCNHDYGGTSEKNKKPKHKPYEPSYGKLAVLRRHHDIVIDHASWEQWLGPWYAKVHTKS